MTQPRPSTDRPNILQQDVLELIGLKKYFQKNTKVSGGLLAAGHVARQRAKRVLFTDLAMSISHGIPMNAALDLCGKTSSQTMMLLKKQGLLRLSFRLPNFWHFVSRGSGQKRLVRILAQRLLVLVESGMTLSAAMKHYPTDFSGEEIAIIEAGEEWGRLGEALARMSEYQISEERLAVAQSELSYFITISIMLFMIGSFITITILPKFEDIFQQLGGELPKSTQLLVEASHFIFMSIASYIITSVVVGYVLLSSLNGSSFSVQFFRLISAIPGLILAAPVFIIFKMGDIDTSDGWLTNGILILGFLYGYIFLAIPLERRIRQLRFIFGRLYALIPLLRYSMLSEARARWLAFLSLGMRAGIPMPMLLEVAGRTTSGELHRKSMSLSRLVEKGISVGDAFKMEGPLPPEHTRFVALADRSNMLSQTFQQLSSDFMDESGRHHRRLISFIEVFGILLMGVTVGLVVYAVYMPLFAIPTLVGY